MLDAPMVVPKRGGSHNRSRPRELCMTSFGSSSSLHRSASSADIRPRQPWGVPNNRVRRLVQGGVCAGLTVWMLLAYVLTPLGAARSSSQAHATAVPFGCAGLSRPVEGRFYQPRGPRSPPAVSNHLSPRALGTHPTKAALLLFYKAKSTFSERGMPALIRCAYVFIRALPVLRVSAAVVHARVREREAVATIRNRKRRS